MFRKLRGGSLPMTFGVDSWNRLTKNASGHIHRISRLNSHSTTFSKTSTVFKSNVNATQTKEKRGNLPKENWNCPSCQQCEPMYVQYLDFWVEHICSKQKLKNALSFRVSGLSFRNHDDPSFFPHKKLVSWPSPPCCSRDRSTPWSHHQPTGRKPTTPWAFVAPWMLQRRWSWRKGILRKQRSCWRMRWSWQETPRCRQGGPCGKAWLSWVGGVENFW